MSVTENIIEATKTLVISIGSGEDFKLTSAEGAQRDYTVSKESEVLSAGSRVLLVPSGTYDGAQDLNFELQGVVSGNTSQKAGIYTDTLNFEAVLTSNYRIEYHMDGGVNDPSNPATYEKDSGDINLANPSKEGYTFDGWYLSEDYSGDAVSVIANGTEGSIDLYAKWSLTPYTISYDLEEGSNDSSNPSGYNLSQLPITLVAPTKAGYTFKGWTGSNGDTPETELTIPTNTTGNLSYTANWELNSYTISYNLNGGVAENLVTSYNATMLPFTLETPTKANYDFAGWYTTDDFLDTAIDIISTSNIGNKTLYAKWTSKQYNIAYHLDGGTATNPTSYTVESLPLTLNNPIKDGYTFLGWYETSDFSGNPVTQINAGSTSNKTFYAKWFVNSYTYNIVYKSNSGKQLGSETATYEYGTTNVINPKEFAGYSTPESQNVAWDSVTKTITFTYTPVTYTIDWELDGGDIINQSTSYNVETTDYTLPIPTKEGYAFAGWFTTSDLSGTAVTKLSTGSTGDKVFYAKWDSGNLNNVTLKYIDNVTPDSNIIVSSVDALPTPSRTGYTFDGWHTGSESVSSGVLAEDDFISDSAYKWTYNSSTGEWESTGNKGKNNSVSVLRTVEFDAKTGDQVSFEWRSYAEGNYDYAAWNIWDVNNSKWLSGASTWGTSYNDSTSGLTPTSGLATTKGKQSSSAYTTNTYTFTADGTYQIYWTYRKDSSDSSGTDLAYVRNVNVPEQTTITISETPVEELSDGLTLYAKWNINEYSISWVLNEGTLSNQVDSYNVKTSYALPTPTRTNYIFEGWYETADFSGSKVVSISKGSTGDKTFYAKWYDNYTITYVLNGGSNNSSNPAYYNSTRSYSLYDPTRTDYVFAGWYETEDFSGSKITSISQGSTGDKTFYAKWYDNYNITYVLNNGTLSGDAKTIYSNGSSYTLSTPTRTDYVFAGWYETEDFSGPKVTSISKGSTGDKTFYAKWYDNYTITYVLNDGTLPSGAKTVYSSGSNYTLPTPTRTDYTFGGWYEIEDFSSLKVISISKGSTGNKTFYAKWYDNYNITYVLNDGILPSDAKTVYSSGSSYKLLAPTKDGYVFEGWYEAEDFSGSKVTSITKGSTGNKTFYAKWYDNYNITYVLNDGILPSDAKTVYSSGSSYKLPAPTKDGYAFNGWYETSDFSGTSIASISKGSTGNKTLYAKWGDSTYKLKTGLAFNKLIPSTTTSIVFTDEVMPTDATLIDVDADGDRGVVGWLDTDGTTFKVSTQKPGQKIIANEDSSYMFCGGSSYGNKTTVTQNLTSITGLENLDTSNVTNMHGMFNHAGYKATSWSIGDLSNWDTSGVTNMHGMFSDTGYKATSWSIGDLSNWDTSGVTDMIGMFSYAGWKATNWSVGDLSNWDTSSVTNMGNMFDHAGHSATTFNLDLSNWDTSGVTDMRGMFEYAGSSATTFNLDLSNWDTSSVTNMWIMFSHAGSSATTFNLDLSNWDTSSVTNMKGLFEYSGCFTNSYSIEGLSNWDTTRVTDMSHMFERAGQDATTWSVENISNWDTSKVTNMTYMFEGAGVKATTFSLDLSSWDTSKVTNMSYMFSGTGNASTTFDLDLSNWNTSRVTNMSEMFRNAGYKATTWSIGDISGWDTSKVTNMSKMFYNAGYNATTWSIGDLSGWDTSKATNMYSMFDSTGYKATTWSIGDISNWNTSSVTDMGSMFRYAGYEATTWSIGDISGWDTSDVTNMSYMFRYAGKNASYNLDLSGWNINKVTYYSYFNEGVETKITSPTWVK